MLTCGAKAGVASGTPNVLRPRSEFGRSEAGEGGRGREALHIQILTEAAALRVPEYRERESGHFFSTALI